MKKLEILSSERLDTLAAKVDLDTFCDMCDYSCTNGYDNDGSTGREVFDNGFEMAVDAAVRGKQIYEVKHPDEDGADSFFLGTEDSIAKRLEEAASENEEAEV